MQFIRDFRGELDKHLLKGGRTESLFINVFNSFFVKVFSVLATFTLIPISMNFVNKEDYGLWLTISSVITFANLLDLGLSTGLKNKLTESFANKQENLAKAYLSTTYTLLILIITILWLCFYFISDLVQWQKVFNTTLNEDILRLSLRFVFSSFCLSFILQPLTTLLMAKQKHYLVTFIQLCGSVMALVAILIYGNYFKASAFLFLTLILSYSYPLALLFFSIGLYIRQFRSVMPTLSYIKFKYSKDLFDLGIKFFVIQVSVLIIYYSNNLLISRLLGNEHVTIYNIAFRYFSLVTIMHSLVIIPLWTAFTDAYVLRDYNWIKLIISKVNKLSGVLCFMLILMCLGSNYVYKIWIDPSFYVPIELSILLAISAGISLYAETYVMFLNGTGRIKWQMYFTVFAAVLHIPAAYFLVKFLDLGIAGIVVLNITWASLAAALWYRQYKQIMAEKLKVSSIPCLAVDRS
jgi:O-antigen/teichoic acid export membrane protein